MDTKTERLLATVAEDRLESALKLEGEERHAAFKEGMEAVTKQIELQKMKQEEERALREEENKKHDVFVERCIQVGTFAAGLVVAPAIEYGVKKGFAKLLCEFEKDYSFTTSAGRSLSDLFKFRSRK